MMRSYRKTLAPVSIMILSLLMVSACGSPPKREPYAGADLVGEVPASSLVGRWKVSILNPIEKENQLGLEYEFKDDGSVNAIMIPPAEQTDTLGPMEFRATGSWQTNGDLIVLAHENIEETTGNKLGGFMATVINRFASKSDGQINPYDVSSDRMIWVHNETGEARLFERL